VLVGTVWLAAGQSNMEFSLGHDAHRVDEQLSFPTFLTSASSGAKLLRCFTVEQVSSSTALPNVNGTWLTATPETIATMAAVPYYYAREMIKHTGAAMGIIVSAWGATGVSTWTPIGAQQQAAADQPAIAETLSTWAKFNRSDTEWREDWALIRYEEAMEKWNKWRTEIARKEAELLSMVSTAKGDSAQGLALKDFWGRITWLDRPAKPAPPREQKNFPGNIFNGMIAPLSNHSIRGVIWYQGEASTVLLKDSIKVSTPPPCRPFPPNPSSSSSTSSTSCSSSTRGEKRGVGSNSRSSSSSSRPSTSPSASRPARLA